ncbi:MAG: 4-alpha-glucanotransferase [Candidatus Poseidoniales archaeon]|nr:MAG: 4-alpha-glucanotransferase [Candidatus Poseidoniales archaeon]
MAQNVGVLCHITSLPNGLEDGERFIDYIVNYGANAWQMLPITPPDEHGSPYASPSAFAAWDNLGKSDQVDLSEESYWLEDWLLYEKIKEKFDGKPWFEWPEEYRDRHPSALVSITTDAKEQSRFMGRWKEVQEYARSKDVSLIGDLPIFVAHDSADVWAHRELFLLDSDGMPEVVAGVPPDYFSEDGQKWGTVLYDWDAHRSENWRWWRERMARMMRQFDIVRIDHFRGFHSAWAIPASDENARNGEWLEAPKDELISALIEVCGNHECIIAEDLGIIPKEVTELRKRHNLQGMSVLQFAFDDNNKDNPHKPENITSDRVVYTGTHDNDTTLGWWTEKQRKRLKPYMKNGETVCQTMIRLARESPANLAIIPLQDILELGSEARMNTPGTAHGNWSWKFTWADLE